MALSVRPARESRCFLPLSNRRRPGAGCEPSRPLSAGLGVRPAGLAETFACNADLQQQMSLTDMLYTVFRALLLFYASKAVDKTSDGTINVPKKSADLGNCLGGGPVRVLGGAGRGWLPERRVQQREGSHGLRMKRGDRFPFPLELYLGCRRMVPMNLGGSIRDLSIFVSLVRLSARSCRDTRVRSMKHRGFEQVEASSQMYLGAGRL